MQYLGGRLRDHAIGTDHFDKPIFQPAQISVRLYHVPAQAGEVCYQQKVNFPSVYRIRNLGQPPAGKVQSAGLFCGSTCDLNRACACSISERYCRFISVYSCSVISLSA